MGKCELLDRLLEKIGDGRKCQQETQDEERECDAAQEAERDRLFAPAEIEGEPDNQPDEDGGGGYAGENACRLVEDESGLDGRGLVGGDGEDGERERADGGSENSGCTGMGGEKRAEVLIVRLRG